MIQFLADDDVDSLMPEKDLRDVVVLLSLLSGREPSQAAARFEADQGRLQSMLGNSLGRACSFVSWTTEWTALVDRGKAGSAAHSTIVSSWARHWAMRRKLKSRSRI